MRLNKFFNHKNKWTKNAQARNGLGETINFMEFSQDSANEKQNRVEKLSLYGALAYFYSQEREPENREKEMMKLKKAIQTYTKKNMFIAEFNDAKETSFEDVQKVLEIYEKL